jgi:hypothetical protein
MALFPVTIQITPESRPTIPPWVGEVAAFAQVLTHEGILTAIQNRVRFARARFGQYEVIDFLTVLFGYAISGECTLEAFYQHLHPFASADHWRFSGASACQHAPHSVAF